MNTRSAKRWGNEPTNVNYNNGFRLSALSSTPVYVLLSQCLGVYGCRGSAQIGVQTCVLVIIRTPDLTDMRTD
jgi:hypothetical protein